MTQIVYKYELNTEHDTVHDMPIGAAVLTAQIDQKTGKPVVWALCDNGAEKEERCFICAPTGWPIQNKGLVYIATLQYENGGYIFHVFEANSK